MNHLLAALRYLSRNPYLTLCVPPILMLLQFLDFILLMEIGLPQSMADAHGRAALCIWAMFALTLFCIPAFLLAVRQVFLLPNKVAPAFGIVFNAMYLVGFAGFFVICFVVRTFT